MDFHKALFLTVFLPLFLLLYGIADRKFKNALLLAASLFFYAWCEPVFVFVLVATTFFDFVLVRIMARQEGVRRKVVLAVSLCMNLSLLGWFKYRLFFVSLFGGTVTAQDEALLLVALPLGISFYTFETITYLLDVYRREQQPLNRFGDYLLYILLFPKLLAGPIIRYGEIASQLQERSAQETLENRLGGFYRLCIGLGKKVLIADQLALYYTDYTLTGIDFHTLGAGSAWLALLACFFRMYFDFSGYTDIALGLGRIFGFRLPENFNNPLLSPNITEFWKRWHMTLTAWMRNYLYIPLGGSRGGKWITYRNLGIVFLVSGLWHGAHWNFLLWGVFHGLLIIGERVVKFRMPRVLGVVFTIAAVSYSMSLFFIQDLDKMLQFQQALFGFNSATLSHWPRTEFWLPFAAAVCFSFFACTPFTKRVQDTVFTGYPSSAGHISLALISAVLFVLSLSYSASVNYNTFVYFRF
ncbi:MAG: MBOAT family protein [Bacteroidetes bacterium]|nr:MBOAT family protein [Bacteroidota bacterium]